MKDPAWASATVTQGGESAWEGRVGAHPTLHPGGLSLCPQVPRESICPTQGKVGATGSHPSLGVFQPSPSARLWVTRDCRATVNHRWSALWDPPQIRQISAS